MGNGLRRLFDPSRRLELALYAGALSIAGLFAFTASMPLISHPTFCAKACHSQQPEWEAWKRSSHARVTCYACHVDKASFTHLAKEKFIAGPLGILAELTGNYDQPINPESHYSQHDLPMERCERCHSPVNRTFTFSKGIYMDHKAHRAAGIDCAVCHNRIAHKGAEQFEPIKTWAKDKRIAAEGGEHWAYKDFTTMKDGCMRCHSASEESRNEEALHLIENGKEPPTACPTCHTRDFELPVGHEAKKWRTEHGAVAQKDFGYCFKCHDEGAKFNNHGEPWCTRCHDDAKVDQFTNARPI